jgi:AraC-like DNA-binding protein
MMDLDFLSLRLRRLKAGEKWIVPKEGMVFILPRAGTGQMISGTSCLALKKGDVLVCSPEPEGKVTCSECPEFAFWHFGLTCEQLFPLFSVQEIPLLRVLFERLNSEKLHVASSPVARECHQLLAAVPPQLGIDHRSQLLRIASVVLNSEFTNARIQEAGMRRVGFVRIEEHMTQVFESLSSNDILSLSIVELANRFNVSRRHLNRLFRAHFGFSVAALRMEMRLLKAVSLLRDPNVKISDVAEQCRFHHLGLFNTCFKHRFGSSPSQWRKTHEQAPKNTPLIEGSALCQLRANGLCPWAGKSAGIQTSKPH